MAINVLDLAKGYLTSSLLESQASQLGESNSAVSKAIGGLLPTVMGGLVNKGAESPNLLNQLTGLVSSGVLNNLGNLGGQNSSVVTGILNSIFGDKMGNIISTISQFAGIKNSSANSLMNLASGAVFGSLGKHALDNKLDASGLTNLLGNQKGFLSSMMPAGLSLGSLGLGGVFDSFSSGAKDVKDTVAAGAKKVEENLPSGGGSNFWKWLIPLLLLGLLLWYFWPKGATDKIKDTASSAVEQVEDGAKAVGDAVGDAADATGDAISSAANRVKEAFTFGDGISIDAYKGGIEDQMISYIKTDKYADATDEELKANWYNFDNVKFVHGSTDELESGDTQLENISKILKAYPDVKIKIGAYTDKTGSDETNKNVSQARADFIQKKLSDLGVGSQITGAEGYGSEFAEAAADAPDEERAKDRKIAIRFSK